MNKLYKLFIGSIGTFEHYFMFNGFIDNGNYASMTILNDSWNYYTVNGQCDTHFKSIN